MGEPAKQTIGRRSIQRTGRPALVVALACAVVLAAASGASSAERTAVSIELTGTIDPATASWVSRALDDARERRAAVAILRLDTPGGLDTSMREIVRRVLAATVA